ncbi:DUF808 domain-containing protein [Chitinolyticbacter meiyuanensis]|uniref:DUF808 domain-containing protein n=1 Tax=Chitinolyticbacter meiyuanensis TaxID=682798 RepID=UPI0011E59FE3|nr:DUF808 domain-containing protein [Chitinolyticbacter meiyuanensis]
MAGTSLLALIDDIASVLDDVAVMTKVAAKKTSGVLGDDLALNAEQVSGVKAERELPVVWAVAKGSFRNKLILVPAALIISAFIPWLIIPLLMVGGAYLCFEGFEKLAHKFLHSRHEDDAHKAELHAALANPEVDLVALEKDKIKGAIRTDFILSGEIIVIALGVVAGKAFGTQAAVLSGIAILMTVGVYGIVAAIVKLDDAGFYLAAKDNGFQRALGRGLLAFAPWLMKALSVIGTAAMFMVGGGILTHGIPGAHDLIHHAAEAVHALPAVGGVLAAITPTLLDLVAGVIAGALVLVVVKLIGGVIGKFKR